jgi:hypothetical protein
VTDTAKADLKRELGDGLPVLDELSDADAADILELFQAARKTEQKQLMAAIDETIDALPWMFRGTARKIIVGKK